MADVLGVTAATVSNAYNRPGQLSAALRERVLETARSLGYAGPDPMARGLRRGRAGAIGVLYADRLSYAFKDPVAVELLSGIATATEAAGLGLLLVSGSPRTERDLDAPMRAAVDGFVIYSMAPDDPLLAAALERRLPIVTVDMPGLTDAPGVAIDDEAAARSVAGHLLALGHRQVAVLSLELTSAVRSGSVDADRRASASYPVTRARLRGYEAAIVEAGRWLTLRPRCTHASTAIVITVASDLLGNLESLVPGALGCSLVVRPAGVPGAVPGRGPS